MRYIAKAAEPELVRRWKAGGSSDWAPSYAALGGRVKDALRDALIQEQGFVCCYCERRVAAGDIGGDACHIEHLVSRDAAHDRDLDYSNLLCSCTATRSAHCGMKKDNRAIEIHPLQQDCASTFQFFSDGSVGPRPGDRGEAAGRTILTLGLNAPSLQDLRRRAVGYFLDLTQDLSPELVKVKAHSLMERDREGRCVPLATAVRSILAL